MSQMAGRMQVLGTETAFEVLVRARALEAQGRSVVHLEIGEPDFDTPAHVCEAAFESMRSGGTHYCPSAGLMEFRDKFPDRFLDVHAASMARPAVRLATEKLSAAERAAYRR